MYREIANIGLDSSNILMNEFRAQARRVHPPNGPLVGLTPMASLEYALELIA